MASAHIHFKHPTMVEGNVHFEDQIYPVYAGVIACPIEIAADGAWPRALEEDIEAYEKLAKGEPQPDPLEKLLDGTVSDVEDALEGPFEGVPLTAEQFVKLGELEAAKGNRKGVQAAIAARVDALKASS